MIPAMNRKQKIARHKRRKQHTEEGYGRYRKTHRRKQPKKPK